MSSISIIKPYFAENRGRILIGLVCLILVDMLQLIVPRVIKWAVDDLTLLRVETGHLLDYAYTIAGIAVLIGVFRYVWRLCLLGTSRRVEEGLRNRLFDHLQTLSAAYFDRTRTGDLMSHATNDIQQIRMAAGMGYTIAGIAVLIGVFRYVWRLCLLGTSRRVEEGLRNRLFDHLQTLSAAYFDRTRTGDLMSHATNDIQQIRMAAGMGLVALNDAVVMGAAAIGFMLYIDPTLTGVVLIPMPFIAVAARFFSRRMHRRYRSVQASFSDLTEAVRERVAGIRLIKAHNRKRAEAEKIEAASRAYVDENLGLVRITGAFFPMMVLLTNLSMALVLVLGGRRTILLTITPGDFVAFISYLGLLMWPMMALGWVTNLIQPSCSRSRRGTSWPSSAISDCSCGR